MKVWQLQETFSMITSLSELYFRFRWFILLVQANKVTFLNYGSSTSCWLWFVLILINSNLNLLTKFTSSTRSTEFKDIFPWNISQMIMKTILISTRIVISHAMKQGILFWLPWKVNRNLDYNTIRISQWR